MTEKRFKEIVSVEKVIDAQTGKEYKCIIDNELLELLNELHEENIRLRRALQIELDKDLPSAPVGHCRCTPEPYRSDGNE